ncbi:MAG TPA: LPS assembly protein LptD [Candidatus Acidoferrales bacterium]|nr:LPS assembly protein LptD [Candidatus Acidoferrales bacterium]
MPKPTLLRLARNLAFAAALLPLTPWTNPGPLFARQASTASPISRFSQLGGEVTLEADRQGGQLGKIYYADGNVDLRYQNVRLRADHMEWDQQTGVVTATGHVQLDYLTQHVEANDARYDLRSGRATFHHVSATFALQRRPTPTLLISPNPLYFQAEEADRVDQNTYTIHKAWLTVCNPNRPTWKFYAPYAKVELQQSVHLEGGNFRVLSIPVLYLPYATFPAEKRRDSGFLIPQFGDSTRTGWILGESVYWAPLDWMDATIGSTYFSDRGFNQKAQIRMRPWENARFEADYFGMIDRGLQQPSGPPIPQGGHEARLLFTALLPGNWRAVADLDQLSSLTFRLAWSETYTQAVNSEVRNTAFLSKNFDGFSLNFAALSYQNFLSATPQTSISLRTAPEARFNSVDRPFFRKLPLYLSFDAFTGAVHRSETVTSFDTSGFVNRSEISPTVTAPFHWEPWLDVTPRFTFRSTYYGAQMQNQQFEDQGFFRNTEEFSLDIRPPTIERVWGGETKWKHAIEPDFVYRYVNGVNDFGRFIRFDEDETLTDTNEVEYGITQRLYRRAGGNDAKELVTWRVFQKYFFDPTFGGALVPGQRNVFQTTDELSPFAFADEPRRFSPIVSDLTIDPGKRYDAEVVFNYDPQRNRMTAIGTLLNLKPYKQSFLTLAHFSTLNLPLNPPVPPVNFQQRSDQVRALFGYGDLTRPGLNLTFGASYDFTQDGFQNQIAEISYNGSCCGFGFEYRKFSFGTIRNENQYLVTFRIANVGSVGNLRRPEKIF